MSVDGGVTCPAKGWGGHDVAHHEDSHHGHECHASAQGQSLGRIVRLGWQNMLQQQILAVSLPCALFWRYAALLEAWHTAIFCPFAI